MGPESEYRVRMVWRLLPGSGMERYLRELGNVKFVVDEDGPLSPRRTSLVGLDVGNWENRSQRVDIETDQDGQGSGCSISADPGATVVIEALLGRRGVPEFVRSDPDRVAVEPSA